MDDTLNINVTTTPIDIDTFSLKNDLRLSRDCAYKTLLKKIPHQFGQS